MPLPSAGLSVHRAGEDHRISSPPGLGEQSHYKPSGWPVPQPGSGLPLDTFERLRRVLGPLLELLGREITAAQERDRSGSLPRKSSAEPRPWPGPSWHPAGPESHSDRCPGDHRGAGRPGPEIAPAAVPGSGTLPPGAEPLGDSIKGLQGSPWQAVRTRTLLVQIVPSLLRSVDCPVCRLRKHGFKHRSEIQKTVSVPGSGLCIYCLSRGWPPLQKKGPPSSFRDVFGKRGGPLFSKQAPFSSSSGKNREETRASADSILFNLVESCSSSFPGGFSGSLKSRREISPDVRLSQLYHHRGIEAWTVRPWLEPCPACPEVKDIECADAMPPSHPAQKGTAEAAAHHHPAGQQDYGQERREEPQDDPDLFESHSP